MKKLKKGFTLVETVIAVGMATFMIALVVKMSGVIGGDVARGTVDLQNLQEARTVINYLRRDFSCAAPKLLNDDDVVARDTIRANPVSNGANGNQNSQPIVVQNDTIRFFKQSLDANGNITNNPDEITYIFNSGTKTLQRHSNVEGNKEFKGIESISFVLCYHKLKPEVPMLLVDMTIMDKDGDKTKSRPLPLKTTICSSVVSKDIINLDWNSVGQ